MAARIVRVEVGRFDYEMAGDFKFFPPGADGKVRRPSVLVRITDEDGYVGWGQCVPIPSWTYETVETVTTTLAGCLAPALLGADAEDIAGIHARMNRVVRPAFSTGQPLCKAGVDLAVHDLVGKRRGVPALDLLGGMEVAGTQPGGVRSGQASITLSWTVASPDMAAAERQMEEGRRRGYRHFNIKVGPPQSLDYDVELARRVRGFAPEAFLWADANTGYTVDDACEAARRLADAGVDVLESPLPPNCLRGYQRLRRLRALPILMDEGILSAVEAEEFAALEMFDGIAMKPARNAGLFPSEQIVNVLKDRGLMILGSGLTDPDLSLAAALHLFAWAGIERPCALNGPQFLAESLVSTPGNPLLPQGGQIALPRGPGLGIELDKRAESVLEPVAEL